jgi:hypothetical protein
MARIIHASNFGRKANGAFQHGVEFKISNRLVRNDLAVMPEAANGYREFIPEGEFVCFCDFNEMIESCAA